MKLDVIFHLDHVNADRVINSRGKSHSMKQKKIRETYLDSLKGFPHRYSTTNLRISDHDISTMK